MENNIVQPTTKTSRRSIVKGAAWAAPVVMATATVPAYAASKTCIFSTYSQQRVTANYGNTSFSTTGQYLTIDFSMPLRITNLYPGETIVNVQMSIFIEDTPGGSYYDRIPASVDQGFTSPLSSLAGGVSATPPKGSWEYQGVRSTAPHEFVLGQGNIVIKNMWRIDYFNAAPGVTAPNSSTGCNDFIMSSPGMIQWIYDNAATRIDGGANYYGPNWSISYDALTSTGRHIYQQNYGYNTFKNSQTEQYETTNYSYNGVY